jgi:hypothetical protein
VEFDFDSTLFRTWHEKAENDQHTGSAAAAVEDLEDDTLPHGDGLKRGEKSERAEQCDEEQDETQQDAKSDVHCGEDRARLIDQLKLGQHGESPEDVRDGIGSGLRAEELDGSGALLLGGRAGEHAEINTVEP